MAFKRKKFTALSEDWGEYRLPNDVIVRSRFMLTFYIQDEDRENEVRVRFHVAVSAMEPPAAEGRSSKKAKRTKKKAKPQTFRSSDLEVIQDAESLYRLEDGRLVAMRLDPQEVTLTGEYREEDEPEVNMDNRVTVRGLENPFVLDERLPGGLDPSDE